MMQRLEPTTTKYNYVLRGWTCRMPNALATPTALAYENDPRAVIDLHSHGRMSAFFSSTDDADEQGFRLYVVIGNVDTDRPTYRDWETDRKSTRLNSSHSAKSRMPSSA